MATKFKRSEKLALWACLVWFVIGVALLFVIGPWSFLVGGLVAAWLYQEMLKQSALHRAVNGELLEK